MKKRPMKRTKRKYKHWTKDEIQRLVDYTEAGVSLTDISEAIGRSYRDCSSKRSRMGLKSKRHKNQVEQNKLRNHSRRWTREEQDKLWELIDSGASLQLCSETLERTISSIENRLGMMKRTRTRQQSNTTEVSLLWGMFKKTTSS